MTDSRARIVIAVLSAALVLTIGAVIVLMTTGDGDGDGATGSTTSPPASAPLSRFPSLHLRRRE